MSQDSLNFGTPITPELAADASDVGARATPTPSTQTSDTNSGPRVTPPRTRCPPSERVPGLRHILVPMPPTSIAAVLTRPLVTFDDFHRQVLPALLAGPHAPAAAAAVASQPPLAVRVDGQAWTYRSADGRIARSEGVAADAGVVVDLTATAFSDLVQMVRTIPALMIAGDVTATGGGPALDRWERALRTLCHGIPIANPGQGVVTDPN